MSQNPPWPSQQGGYPQNYPQQGGYPQQGYPPAGYPQQGSSQGQPPQGQPSQGQPPQGQPQGGYQPQSYLGPFQGQQPQGGYPGQGGQGGYQPPPTGPYGTPPGSQPPRRSTGVIIGIVVAAVVLLVAVGGIVMALGSRGGDDPVSTITPTPLPVPSGDPTPGPTETPEPQPSQPTDPPTTAPPTTAPPTKKPTTPPSADSIDLGNGVRLTPADDWQLKSKKKNAVQLANGRDIFIAVAAKDEPGNNPTQTCDGYHREVAKQYTDAKFSDPKKVDLGTSKLKGATCAAQVTLANGGDSLKVYIFSLVSVRTDGLTVVGSLYFTEDSDVSAINKDFNSMVNSMLRTQAAGG